MNNPYSDATAPESLSPYADAEEPRPEPLSPYADPEEPRPNAATPQLRTSRRPIHPYVAFLRAECHGRAYNLELVRHLRSSFKALDLPWLLFSVACLGPLLVVAVVAAIIIFGPVVLSPYEAPPSSRIFAIYALFAAAGLLVGVPVALGGAVAVIKAVRNGGSPEYGDLLFFFRGMRRYTRALVAGFVIFLSPNLLNLVWLPVSVMMNLVVGFAPGVVPRVAKLYLKTRLYHTDYLHPLLLHQSLCQVRV